MPAGFVKDLGEIGELVDGARADELACRFNNGQRGLVLLEHIRVYFW
jgi:hypothetical protein